MIRKNLIRILIVCIMLMALFSNAVYASNFDASQDSISQYLGLIALLMLLFVLIMIGIFIVLIMMYKSGKKRIESVCKIIEDNEGNKCENVINIRKHNDQELLDKLYSHIDSRLNEISEKVTDD